MKCIKVAGKFDVNEILQKGQPDLNTMVDVVRAVNELEAPQVPTSPELRLPTAVLPEKTEKTTEG